jgi:hypothetical protein
MHDSIEEAPQTETRAAGPQDLPVSRRRFLQLGAAWTVGLAAFVAGCGGEDEDDGDEEEDD